MSTVTISKKITKGEDLVVMPRREYEEFFQWKETMKLWKEFVPTLSQKKDLKNARKDYKKGNYLTLNELKRRLDFKN